MADDPFLRLDLRVVRVTLPAVVALGPLMVARHVLWNRRLDEERTTWQHRQAEPRHGRFATSTPELFPERVDGRETYRFRQTTRLLFV